MAETSTPVAGTPAGTPVGKKKNRKKKIRSLIIAVVVLALLGAGGVALYRFLQPDEEAQGEIYSQPAFIGSIQSKVSGSGTARAKESAAITLTQSGTVQEVFITAGQTIMAGEPLYTIFSQAAQEAVTTAEDALTTARERVTTAQEEVELAREKVEELGEELAELYESMEDLTVEAPFAGKLTQVTDLTDGQDVAEGTTLATLVNDRQLRLSLYFSYAYDGLISPGQSVEVAIPAVMDSFTGRVEKVNRVHYITPEGSDHFEVVVVFDNPGTLTAGMSATASLTAGGIDVYPYEGGVTEYYEIREIKTEAAGPLLSQALLRYANVEEGQVLLTMGPDEIDEQIEAKREEIEDAEEAVSEAQDGVTEAVEGVTDKEEELTEAMEALSDFNAVAPIDGTVISCSLTPGAEVKSGDTVVMISNTTTMLVTIQVDDRNISFIQPGSYVDLDWNGQMYQGLVNAIDLGGAQAGQGMTNYPVTLTVDNFDGSLMDGAWLQYSFVTSESDGCILVPTTAVKYVSDMEGNRKAVVFVRRETRPEDVPELDLPEVQPGMSLQFPTEEDGFYPVIVETGISDAQNVEILSGVEVDDDVFVNYTITEYGSSW